MSKIKPIINKDFKGLIQFSQNNNKRIFCYFRKNSSPLVFIFILLLFAFIISASPTFAKIQELDIYNEWYFPDSKLKTDKPFFLIQDYEKFYEFWNKSGFKGSAPYFDFDKYMVFVWAPGYTRKDYSEVNFDRLVYKDGSVLVLIDFKEKQHFFSSTHKPVKFAIFQKLKNMDIFVFKKIKTGWRSYSYQPIYAIWDMSGERTRPFEYVLMDQEKPPEYNLDTFEVANATNDTSTNNQVVYETSKPTNTNKSNVKPITVVKPQTQPQQRPSMTISTPRALPEPIAPKMQTAQQPVQPQSPTQTRPSQPSSQPSQPAQPPKQSGTVNNNPIVIGGAPAPKVDSSSKPETAPAGIDDDPLFGSEFDITF